MADANAEAACARFVAYGREARDLLAPPVRATLALVPRLVDEEERLARLVDGKPDPLLLLLAQYATVHDALEAAAGTVLPAYAALAPLSRLAFHVAVANVARLAWDAHADVRALVGPHGAAPGLQTAVAASWLAVVRALLLVRLLERCRARGRYDDPWPELLGNRAQDFACVVRARSNMLLSTDAIGLYSVRTWRYALAAAYEALAAAGWTPSLSAYVRALTLRYAVLVAPPPLSVPEEAAVFDHPTLCRARARPRPHTHTHREEEEEDEEEEEADEEDDEPSVIALPPGLRNALVQDTCERTLFFALRHVGAAAAFYDAGRLLWPEGGSAWRVAACECLARFVTAVATDAALRTMLSDRVKDVLVRRYTLPGECEEAAALNHEARQENDAETVLYDMRRDVFMRLQRLKEEPLTSIMGRWVAATRAAAAAAAAADADAGSAPAKGEARDAWWEAAAVEHRFVDERAVLLIVQSALDITLNAADVRGFSFTSQAFPDDSGTLPPRDRPPASPAEALAAMDGRGAPVFVAVAHLYAVVVHEAGAATCVTPHLVDALACWLNAALSGGKLNARHIHATLHPMLGQRA